QQDRDLDVPVLGRVDGLHHAELGDRLADLRVVDGGEGGVQGLGAGGGHEVHRRSVTAGALYAPRPAGTWAGASPTVSPGLRGRRWPRPAPPARPAPPVGSAPPSPPAGRAAPSAGSRGWRRRAWRSAGRPPRG